MSTRRGSAEGEAVRIYRAYNAAENARDGETMHALLAPDIAIEMNGRPALSSAEDDAVAMAALFDAYPDYHREIVAVVDDGARAAIRWRMVGQGAARFRGRLPDLDVQGCSFIEVEGGRMTRAWLYSAEGQIDAVLALAGTQPPDGGR
jgi:predicted ester cyclase